MGVVRKQSIYSFIFIFVGFAIGAINALFLYRHFLTVPELGLTNAFGDFYVLLSALAVLGSLTTLYKFYPLYNARLGRLKNDLPFLTLAVSLFGCAMIVVGTIVFKDLIVRKYGTHSPLLIKYFYLLLPLTISVVLLSVFESFAHMLKRTVALNIIKEIGFRLVQTVIIILYAYKVISIDTFFLLFSLMYVPSIILLAWLVFRNEGIKINMYISRLTKRVYKKLISFALFHFSGTIIRILPSTLTGIMIASISKGGLTHVAIYTIAKYMVTILEVPLRGMRGIGVATISEALHQNDAGKIQRMYQKSSLNLLIVGLLLFGLIYPNIHTVISLTKGEYFQPAAQIFLILSAAKLIELSMGMNDYILSLSKYWKVDFFITIGVILLYVPVNYYLIKRDPLIGAAVADALLLLFFCLLRFIAVLKLFKIQPYTFKTILILAIAAVCVAITYLLPIADNKFLDTGIKLLVFSVLYIGLIFAFRISHEFLDLYQLAKNKIRR